MHPIKTRIAGFAILTLFAFASWPTIAAADEGCKAREITLNNDDEEEIFDIPDLDLGQSHQGYNREGQVLLATCTESGLRLDIDGEPIVTFRGNMIRVGGEDDGFVTVLTDGKDDDGTSRVVMVSGDDGESSTFTMTFDDEGEMDMWGSDEDGETRIIKLKSHSEHHGEHGTTTHIWIEAEDEDGHSKQIVTHVRVDDEDDDEPDDNR